MLFPNVFNSSYYKNKYDNISSFLDIKLDTNEYERLMSSQK